MYEPPWDNNDPIGSLNRIAEYKNWKMNQDALWEELRAAGKKKEEPPQLSPQELKKIQKQQEELRQKELRKQKPQATPQPAPVRQPVTKQQPIQPPKPALTDEQIEAIIEGTKKTAKAIGSGTALIGAGVLALAVLTGIITVYQDAKTWVHKKSEAASRFIHGDPEPAARRIIPLPVRKNKTPASVYQTHQKTDWIHLGNSGTTKYGVSAMISYAATLAESDVASGAKLDLMDSMAENAEASLDGPMSASAIDPDTQESYDMILGKTRNGEDMEDKSFFKDSTRESHAIICIDSQYGIRTLTHAFLVSKVGSAKAQFSNTVMGAENKVINLDEIARNAKQCDRAMWQLRQIDPEIKYNLH